MILKNFVCLLKIACDLCAKRKDLKLLFNILFFKCCLKFSI